MSELGSVLPDSYGSGSLTYDDFMQGEWTPEWLVGGVLAIGESAVLYGRPDAYKTWLALSLALSVAAGTPWLGHFPIERARNVLYLNLEMPWGTWMSRIEQLAEGMGLPRDVVGGPFQHRTFAEMRLNEGTVDELRDAFAPFDFIVVDSLRRALEGDENVARDVSRFWSYADALTMKEKSFLVMQHLTKSPGKKGNSMDRVSGSGYILGGADVWLSIERRRLDATVVDPERTRFGPPRRPFLVGFSGDGWNSESGPVVMSFVEDLRQNPRDTTKTQALEHITNFLRSAPDGQAATRAIHASVMAQGIKERTSEAALKEMKEAGLVLPVKRGVWQLRTA